MKSLLLSIFSLSIFFVFSQNMIHKEVLGRPTFNAITIQTFYDQEVEVLVEYGLQSDKLTQSTNWQKFPDNESA